MTSPSTVASRTVAGRGGGRPTGNPPCRPAGRGEHPEAGAHRRRDRGPRCSSRIRWHGCPRRGRLGPTSSSTGATSGTCADGDPERNETQAREALLDHVRVDPAKVHPMGPDRGTGPSGAEAAAAASTPSCSASNARPEDHGPVPSFDVLPARDGTGRATPRAGVPHSPAVYETERTVVAVHGCPKPPPTRVTLTLPAIRRGQRGVDRRDRGGEGAGRGDGPRRRRRDRRAGGGRAGAAPDAVAHRPGGGQQAAPRPGPRGSPDRAGEIPIEQDSDLHVVVDGANVVGSRPDGWWQRGPGRCRAPAGRPAGRRAGRAPGRAGGGPGGPGSGRPRAGAPRAGGRGRRAVSDLPTHPLLTRCTSPRPTATPRLPHWSMTWDERPRTATCWWSRPTVRCATRVRAGLARGRPSAPARCWARPRGLGRLDPTRRPGRRGQSDAPARRSTAPR